MSLINEEELERRVELLSLKVIKKLLPEILGKDLFISRSKAAEERGVHKNTLVNWEKQNKLTPIMKDGEIHYSRLEIHEAFKKKLAS